MHGFYSELIYHIVLWARLNINILTLFDEQLFYYKLLSKISKVVNCMIMEIK